MKFPTQLTLFFFRQSLWVTLLGLVIAIGYVLYFQDIIRTNNDSFHLFILIHSIAIAVILGRFRNENFIYAYTRGYSRNQLYLAKMSASILSVLTVWLPVALVIWLPIRSVIQDKLFQSPYFPFMETGENILPLFWLWGYALLLPMFHYVWIRRAQPIPGSNGTVLLAIGYVMVVVMHSNFYRNPAWLQLVLVSVTTLSALVLLIGTWKCHQKMEMQR